MNDEEDSPAVPSPCIDVCVMDGSGYCVGCSRQLDEIARWGSMTDDERRTVLSILPGRRTTARRE